MQVSIHMEPTHPMVRIDTCICSDSRFPFYSHGDWSHCVVSLQPDTVTGDIVFVLQQKEHPKFKRKGDDLFFEHSLSLTEALCGFHFILTHCQTTPLNNLQSHSVKGSSWDLVKTKEKALRKQVPLWHIVVHTISTKKSKLSWRNEHYNWNSSVTSKCSATIHLWRSNKRLQA